MENNKKIWFRRKLYGWGWTPVSWEGNLFLLIWIIIFVSLISRINYYNYQNIVIILVMIGVLIFICYKRGEKPRWQWGERKD
jgi:hypothetical protein